MAEEKRRVVSSKEREWLESFRKATKSVPEEVRSEFVDSNPAFCVRTEVLMTPRLAKLIDDVVLFNKEEFENRSTFLRSCAIRFLRERGDWV